MRVQQREDGAIVDEIVLSPDTYLTAAPGVRDNDTTILPANDGSGSPPPPPPPPSEPDVVLWTANVAPSAITGNWQALSDTTAAGGAGNVEPRRRPGEDLARARVAVELLRDDVQREGRHRRITCGFGCARRTTRCRTIQSHLQFSDSVDSGGSPIMRMGTTGSAEVVLQDGSSGAADHGWGWSDNGWGVPGVEHLFRDHGHAHDTRTAARGRRVVDQIVLSPGTYLTTAPGPRRDDTTIISP